MLPVTITMRTDPNDLLEVTFDREDDRHRAFTEKACQQCEAPVELTEPHAFVRVKKNKMRSAWHERGLYSVVGIVGISGLQAVN